MQIGKHLLVSSLYPKVADLSFVNTREFSRLISKPSTLTVFDMAMLEDLVVLYPFSAPLHASYAFALKKFKPEKYEEYLSKAALYTPDRTLLHKIINRVADFENEVQKTEASGYLLDDPEFLFEEEHIGTLPENLIKIEAEADEIPDDDWLNKQLQGTSSSYQEENENLAIDEPTIIEEPKSTEDTLETIQETESAQQEDIAVATEVAEPEVEKTELQSTEEPAENTSQAESTAQVHITVATEPEAENTELQNIGEPTENIAAEEDEIIHTEVDENFLNVINEETSTTKEPLTSDEQINHTEIDEDFFVEPPTNFPEGDNRDEEDQLTESESVDRELVVAETADFSKGESSDTAISEERYAEKTQQEEEDDYLLEQTSAAAIEIINQGAEYQQPFENTIETVIPDTEALVFIERPVEDDTISEGSEPDNVAPAQNQIIGSIASTDYFIFDKSAIDPLKNEDELRIENQAATTLEQPVRTENSEQISRYDDDKMPFSFLWWLNKTRKEHAESFQPYTSKVTTVNRAASGELNQQIIENIFHIQPEINVFEDLMQAPVTFEGKRKEDVIIEKFITEDPQIRPPKGEKLDTENKARKSSEDNLDLVSETLAKIYTDQMLYHKAIDTYRKLSLKYPEKRSYFAGQILDLEKRFN